MGFSPHGDGGLAISLGPTAEPRLFLSTPIGWPTSIWGFLGPDWVSPGAIRSFIYVECPPQARHWCPCSDLGTEQTAAAPGSGLAGWGTWGPRVGMGLHPRWGAQDH